MTRGDLRAMAWAAAFAHGLEEAFARSDIAAPEVLTLAITRGRRAVYYFDQVQDQELAQFALHAER